jgi:Rrf2 family iron-sulfur cluster assembly transcriptional regulator
VICLSQTTGYAVSALATLHDTSSKPRLIREVADRTGIPKPYLARLINQLSRRGLVVAKRGYRGGIALSRPPEAIPLVEIVEAVEGKDWLGPCLLGLGACETCRACPTNKEWQRIRREITTLLQTTTLADVIRFMEPQGDQVPGDLASPRRCHPTRDSNEANQENGGFLTDPGREEPARSRMESSADDPLGAAVARPQMSVGAALPRSPTRSRS